MNKMKDFLADLDLVGFTSRIKRLSDDILYSTRDYYKSQDLDIEPNWHLIFLLLEEKSMTLTEISEELRISHPACVKIINKMKKIGYILAKPDQEDSRKQILELTEKSRIMLPEYHKHWNAGIATIHEITADCNNILEELQKIEKRLSEGSYKIRTLRNYYKQ